MMSNLINVRSVVFIGVFLATAFSGIFAQGRDRLSREEIAELSLQTSRFHALVAAKKFESSEAPLAIISTLVHDSTVNALRAELALHQQDYKAAYQHLKVFFEGNNKSHKQVIVGAEKFRAWYWFLLVQNGESEKADKTLKALLSQKMHRPDDEGDLDPASNSSNKMVQVYLYMAGYHAAQLNCYRAEISIQRAKSIDQKVEVDPGFESLSNRCGHVSGTPDKLMESGELLPVLDHLAYEKKVGHKAILN